MKQLRVLILEDDLEAQACLIERLTKLEDEINVRFGVTVLSEYHQVEEYINTTDTIFDIVLLDRDCFAGGSFHALDFEKVGVDNIVSISSIPPYNEAAKEKGVTRIVFKDNMKLREFADMVGNEVKVMVLKRQ